MRAGGGHTLWDQAIEADLPLVISVLNDAAQATVDIQNSADSGRD